MALARTPLQILRARWRTPLVFFQVYLAITLWLFFYGPWPWSVDNPTELFSFLAAAQVAIAAGYLLSWKQVLHGPAVAQSADERLQAAVRLLKVSLFIGFVLAVPTSLSRTGAAIPNVASGLNDVGLAYNENFDRLEAGNAYVLVEYLRILTGPWLTAVFPLTVFYWGRLNWTTRIVALAVIGFNLAIYLATGTNKGIADVIITLPWLLYLAVAGGLLKFRHFRLKASIIFGAIFVAFLFFFGTGQQQRSGSGTEYGTFFNGAYVLQADSNNFISSLLPEDARIIWEALSRYVVHGYYALSMAFDTHTPSTLGFGNSMFLARNADAFTNSTFFTEQSIPGALERESGWGMFQLWHSIYPWLASDFGFPGTLVVMAGFGYLLGLCWGRCLTVPSGPWVVLLYLLIILFFYIPANNQIFQSGETCIAFFALLVWALRGRRRGPARSTHDQPVIGDVQPTP